MKAIEAENEDLKDVLPKTYGRFDAKTLKELLENNTKRIKILEEMARSLYREWFVNFRFPGHEKVKLVASPIGKMPDGWTAGALGDVVVLQRGFDLPERERRSGSVPVISSSGITGTHDTARVDAPGIVTGRYGTLGEVYFVCEPFWPLNTTLFVKDFKGSDPYWLLYLLRSMNFSRQNAAGAVPGINRNALHLLGVRIAPRELQARFGSLVDPLLQQIELMQRRNNVLAGQRDLLLPRLISGELDVSRLEVPAG
ncbi:restriction endonuclease subunit S [Sorangium sp. So ce1036]|uniref:restriction endonuclease subunit S n=1 Tax=Sorangium sp. So ce1036 TaxID=3133328 RepID=UPI003EFBB9BF